MLVHSFAKLGLGLGGASQRPQPHECGDLYRHTVRRRVQYTVRCADRSYLCSLNLLPLKISAIQKGDGGISVEVWFFDYANLVYPGGLG